MGFTEFYSVSGGDNLAAGSTIGAAGVAAAPAYTSVAGDWDGVSVFTPNDGSTPANTVSAGDWLSVYITIGATVAVYVARVTAVAAGVNGAITVSTTAKSGTAPVTSAGLHTMTAKVGGSWAQPTGATLFPVSFFKSTLTNVSGNMPRLNAKGTWSMSATLTQQIGPNRIEGMTAVAGDGGYLTIDGGGNAVGLFISGTNTQLVNAILQNTTGNFDALTAGASLFRRVRCTNIGGSGITGSSQFTAEQCEFDNCNTSNTAFKGGAVTRAATYDRCLFHHNSGSNGAGFVGSISAPTFINCVFFQNTLVGLESSTTGANCCNCDFYGNTDGIRAIATGQVNLKNCNFALNSGFGVNVTAGTVNLELTNCGFGTGVDANGTDVVAASATVLVENINPVSYTSPTNPWVSPSTGNFSLASAQAFNAGIGSFLELGESQSGTVAYPDIGAGQHNSTHRGYTVNGHAV